MTTTIRFHAGRVASRHQAGRWDRIALGGAAAALLLLLATAAHAQPAKAPSPCRGLESTVCASTANCRWQPALVKGETQTKAGTPARTNRKAHCRSGKRS